MLSSWDFQNWAIQFMTDSPYAVGVHQLLLLRPLAQHIVVEESSWSFTDSDSM